jgi:lysozyme
MSVNAATLDLIKSFEGYHKRRPDGGCEAYQEVINGKADIPTIGWGCTRGIKMGMVWTKAQAEAALAQELSIHERRVDELVKCSLNENERGALVCFDYNCGGLTIELKDGTKAPSKVLQCLNRGDKEGALHCLEAWNKYNGKVTPGLVRRRKAEIALFLKPAEEPAPDFMPQAVDPDRTMIAVADLRPVSRKMRLLNRIKLAAAGTTTSFMTMSTADWFGFATEFTGKVKQVAADHMLLLVCVGGAVAVGSAWLLEEWHKQDYQEGRYDPSEGS